jgi:hypothetical protein
MPIGTIICANNTIVKIVLITPNTTPAGYPSSSADSVNILIIIVIAS